MIPTPAIPDQSGHSLARVKYHSPGKFRPPVGIPSREKRSWIGTIVSSVFHLLLLLLILLPLLFPEKIEQIITGAGGPGPAGGGGGGHHGSGGASQERIQYVRPPEAPKPPTPT